MGSIGNYTVLWFLTQSTVVPNTADRSSTVQKVLSITDESGGLSLLLYYIYIRVIFENNADQSRLERAQLDCAYCQYNCKNCNCRELSLSLSADNACVWLGPLLQKNVNLLSGKSRAVWGGDRVYSVHCKCIAKMQV